MLLSFSTAVFALNALAAARPEAGVRKNKRDTIIGPSAAYQIYKAAPDRTFNLVGLPDGSGNGYPSSAGTESLTNLESATDSPDATVSDALTSDAASTTIRRSSGDASSTSGFIIGSIGARQVTSLPPSLSSEASSIASSVSNIVSEGFGSNTSSPSLPSLAFTDVSISSIPTLPSFTSASSTASSEPATPSMASSNSITSSDSGIPSTTSAKSTDSSTLSAMSPAVTKEGGISFDLSISQDENYTNSVDVIVSFSLSCENTPGPFSFEFNFVPDVGYSSRGEGRIDVYKVNGELGAGPTYRSVEAATGSLVGTFELPTGADAEKPKLIYINQLVCEPVINLRFGITDYSSAAGAVAYFNQNGMGLRERSG